MHEKRGLHGWKEAYMYGKSPTNMERDPYIWTAKYTDGKRLKNVARDIHA